MNKSQILQKAKAIIAQHRQQAEKIAAANLEKAKENSLFNTNCKNIDHLEFQIAKMEFEGKDTKTENELLNVLQKERVTLLKKLNMQESDFIPKYTCNKCNDTGLVGNKYCSCLDIEINKLLTQDLGLNINKSHTFNSCDAQFLIENNLNKEYKTLNAWVNKFPDSKYKNFVFVGPAGSGKTYLTECIANEFIKKQIAVNFVTAFNLNNLMLKYHTTFDDSKDNILEGYITCPVLIIDDLGTEPILKNVTKEYLYLILNERIINNRSTIITTNLSLDGIIDRYGERIFSRMFNKQNCLKLNFEKGDLRIKLSK